MCVFPLVHFFIMSAVFFSFQPFLHMHMSAVDVWLAKQPLSAQLGGSSPLSAYHRQTKKSGMISAMIGFESPNFIGVGVHVPSL